MAIVTANGLAKYFGGQDVFSGISFEVNHGDKIALLGPNGAGKTTLLRLLYGIETPNAGSVAVAKRLQIGYLAQETLFVSQQTLYNEMLSLFEDLLTQREQLHHLEATMGAGQASPELLAKYGKMVERFEAAGGYEYEHRIHRILGGLGFHKEDYEKPLDILSGGQRTRAQLAKLLLQNPQLLLLDEPTNHLDLAAIEWLEKYLQNWPGSLIVVAHDRYFLDKVVNRVWELSFGRLEQYRGNYSSYVQQRAALMARRLAEYEQQQEHIAETEEFIRRYGAGQRAREARGREKRLERLERVERPQIERELHMSLQAAFRSGNDVLATKGLVVGYIRKDEQGSSEEETIMGAGEKRVLFSCPDLLLQWRQRVALLGPNGSGKTTFLRTILGQVAPLAGQVRLGGSVKVGHLAQSHEDLDPSKTVLEEILSVKNLPLLQARNLLGRFLFSGDDVFKPVSTLSGGERGRVALAKLALQGANFLLLDEPTNHLDISAQEILEQVLRNFNGTILFVSHDRYLIDALATHLWVIDNKTLRAYEGNYSTYIAEQEKLAQEQSAGRASEEKKRPSGPYQKAAADRVQKQKSQLASELEAAIVELESRLATLEADLLVASREQRVGKIRELGSAYAMAEQELHEKLAAWAAIEHG